MSPCMIHSNPSRMPTTSIPPRRARIVAAPITLLIPGAGPPPTRIASLFMTRVSGVLVIGSEFGARVRGLGLGARDSEGVSSEPRTPSRPSFVLQRLGVGEAEPLAVLAAQQLLTLERLIARRHGVGDPHVGAVVVDLLAGPQRDYTE